jgi:mannose-6-phosphate isomerase
MSVKDKRMKTKLYPLIFTPVLKNYLWGGDNLAKFGRNFPKKTIVAESWEIAAHQDGATTVENGFYAGYSLPALQRELGLDLIGQKNHWAHKRDKFPWLVKLLDANRALSVQVHPNDSYALQHENNELGKTEMWVILHAEPQAKIILGVKNGTTPESFKKALQKGQAEAFFHTIPVKTGDHICVPAGSLHAILGGIIIVEIQQNSNATYRVYDWDRVGADGKPRPLHVAKALDVIDFTQTEPSLSPPTLIAEEDGIRISRLCANPYFVTERIELDAGANYRGFCSGQTMEIWGALKGRVSVNALFLNAVRFTLLPAALGEYRLHAETPATLLRIYAA